MHETRSDLTALQSLLDRSYETAGRSSVRWTGSFIGGRFWADSGPVYARIEAKRIFSFWSNPA